MLTVDLIRTRRRGPELQVVRLDGRMRDRALELAELYRSIALEHVGRAREELEQALGEIPFDPSERKLALGLRKLIDDRCTFDGGAEDEPEELRRELFLRAAELRRGLGEGEHLDRATLIAEAARARGRDPEEIERLLYADLRAAHRLQAVDAPSAGALVQGYDLAQAQAVLLRAVRVAIEVKCASPGAYRALFRKLKFLRLLHVIRASSAAGEGGYRIEIDGPMSLFESVTRYGLSLAMLLPELAACERYRLEAELRWGKERVPLTFRLEGEHDGAGAAAAARLPDEVEALRAGFTALDSGWKVGPARAILELPGVGLCVPDLQFDRGATRVYLEVLGYWSREAVWRRVDLVERGLPHKILFAVSQRLRVSEAALDGESPGALYVYKGTMRARAVAEKLAQLAPA